jgi:ABC-2 type transport system permease protein
MQQIIEIARKEMRMLFYSPAGWITLLIFGVHAVFCLVGILDGSIRMMQDYGYSENWYTRDFFSSFRGVFQAINYYMFLYIPFLTMGLFSREFNEGGVKLLFSSPIRTHQIILGKYAAMLVTGLMMIMIYALLAIAVRWFVIDSLDIPLLLSGMLVSYLVICLYSAIGLFVSSLTTYMLVAAVGTFAILFVLQTYLNELIGHHQPQFLQLVISEWLPPTNHLRGMFGLLPLNDIVYFFLMILFFLMLTWIRIYFLKNPRRVLHKVLVYSFAAMALFFAGWLSYQPKRLTYLDFTGNRFYSPGKELSAELEKLPGDLKFKRYVNILEEPDAGSLKGFEGVINTLHSSRLSMRLKPDIEYISYYDHTGSLDYSLSNTDSSLRDAGQLAAKNRISYNRSTKGLDIEELKQVAVRKFSWLKGREIKTGSELSSEVDLTSPQNRRVYFLESGMLRGRLSIRLGAPREKELVTALKVMNQGKLIAGYFHENGEHDPFAGIGKGYYRAMGNPNSTLSLVNNGFKLIRLKMEDSIPDSLSLLIIADPSRAYDDTAIGKISDYLDRGGNMLLTTSPGNETVVAKLLHRLGLEAGAESNCGGYAKIYAPSVKSDSVTGILHRQVLRLHRSSHPSVLTDLEGNGLSIATHKALSMRRSDSVGQFTYYPLALCDRDTIIYGLQRNMHGMEQRILIAGTSDFMSDEIEGIGFKSSFKTGAANWAFVSSIFHWFTNGDYPVFISKGEPVESLAMSDSRWFKYGLLSLMVLPFLIVGLPLLVRRRKV